MKLKVMVYYCKRCSDFFTSIVDNNENRTEKCPKCRHANIKFIGSMMPEEL